MKKRMFITTIVMMLVLAVALTTSSLAWFSSANTTVTATQASFYANTESNGAKQLKIANTNGTWLNSIALTSDTTGQTGGGHMRALIPTKALVTNPVKGDNIKATGVTINGNDYPVTIQGYMWDGLLSFNGAKIDNDTSTFQVDGNNTVDTSSNHSKGSTNGYYFDYFFLKNAATGESNYIDSLKFTVESELSATGTDYPARAYTAFIIYDLVEVQAGTDQTVVPSNAVTFDGTTVIASTFAGKTIVASVGDITDSDTEAVATSEDGKVSVWVPFAAFTIASDNTGTNGNGAWQFANLSTKNGVATNALDIQNYDGLSGTSGDGKGFTLNTDNLKMLNNKVAYGDVQKEVKTGSAVTGNYMRPESATDSLSAKDATSTFRMNAGEVYLVNVYFWLDGYTLDDFSDTTVATLKINVSAN